MEIEVSGYVLETEFMAMAAGTKPEDKSWFNVYLKYKDSKHLGVVSFGVQVPAKEYSPEELKDLLYKEAYVSIERFEKEQAERREQSRLMYIKENELAELGARVAGASGVTWLPPKGSKR